MLQLRAAAVRPEIHALRVSVEDLLDEANPSHGAIFATFSAVLADCIANAPPDIRASLIDIIHDVLATSTRKAHGARR
jgi:hypothetical protein